MFIKPLNNKEGEIMADFKFRTEDLTREEIKEKILGADLIYGSASVLRSG